MGNLTSITIIRHFSDLTMTASKSLPNSTANPLCSIKKMNLKLTLTILTLIFISKIVFTQSRYDYGLAAVPTYSTINTEGHVDGYKYISPLNYGIYIAYKKKKILISSGILKITQGTKFETEITTVDQPEGGTGTYDLFIRVKGIIIPLNFNYVLTSNNTEISGGVGIYSGYIFSQQLENTSIPKDYQPPDNIVYFGDPPKRFVDLDWFDKYYLGINIGFGLQQYFCKKMSFIIRPNFLFQLRKELPRDEYVWTNRLMSFSLDVGLCYSIGRDKN